MLDHTAIVTLIAFALILGSFFTARILAAVRLNRPKLPPLACYGDVVELPAAAKLTRGGNRKARSDGLAHKDVIARRHNGTGL
jgi:hypothetical protein